MLKVNLQLLKQKLLELTEMPVLSILSEEELYVKECLSGEKVFGDIDFDKLTEEAKDNFALHVEKICIAEQKNNRLADSLEKIKPYKKEQEDFSFL